MAYPDPILEEVRWLKADLLKAYGGIDGLNKHLFEEQRNMEKEGHKFVTYEELQAKKNTAQHPCCAAP